MRIATSCRLLKVGLLAVLFSLHPLAGLRAQTWTGSAGDGYWGTAGNWSPATVPNAVSAVASLGANATVNSGSTYTLGTLNFTGSSGAFALNSPGTINLQVSSGTPNISVASGVSLYFYATLNGSQGFNKTGSGKFTFRYSNVVQPFSGNITIAAGTLGIQGDFSLGNTNNDITISNSATLLEENSSGLGSYTLAPTRTITLAGASANIAVNSGETLAISGVIQDSPAGQPLVFNSSGGTLVLSGTNTYSGGTTVTAGTLSIGASNNLGAAGSSLTLNGGTLQITGTSLNNFLGSGHPSSFSSGKMVTLDINNAGNTFTVDTALNQGTGGLTKLGAGTLVSSLANTYTGATTISAGTLALGGSGSINNTASINIAAGATYDVSAISSYALGSSATLTGSGNASAATIKGSVSGSVNFGSRPVTLNFDGSDPTLTISQGSLNLAGQTFTVNYGGSSALVNGIYKLIQVNSGNIIQSGSFNLTGTVTNGTAGGTIGFATNAGIAYVQLTITGSTNGSSTTNQTDISSYQADAFESYLLANQSVFPNDFFLAVPGDDASVGSYIANLNSSGLFADITYPTSSTATVVQGGGGWMIHLPRLYAIYKALINTSSTYYIVNNPSFATSLMPKLITGTFAYTHAPWDITDQWNYIHTWSDLCEVYALGSVCLYARQINRLSSGLIPVNSIDAWGNRIPDLFRNGHVDTTHMVPSNGVVSPDHQANLNTGGNMIWTSQGIVLKYLTQSTNSVRLEGLDATFQHIWSGGASMGAKHESPSGWPVYTALPQMSVDYMLGEHYTPYLLVYGGAFLNGIIQWRNGMANFPRWAMPPADMINQLFADCMINGVAPVNQGYPDRILLSRGLTVGGYYSPTYNLNTWLNNIVGYGYRTNELQQLLTWNNNNRPGATPWPFTNHTFTHFFSSDYSCQHYPNYLVTFRGISQRTCGIENLQNPLAGYFPQGRQIFVPLGGSYIYATGNEYGPVSYTANSAVPWENSCDYTRIPGVTTKTVPDSAFTNYWRDVYGNLPFAGTAAANNSGVSGWEQSRYVQTDQWLSPISLSGNSAVFYLDMAVVHLGAGFDTTQDTNATTTSLNQCLSATNVITYGLTNGTTQTIPNTGGGVTNVGINWALYQGVGYLPPNNGVKVLRDVQQNNVARVFSFYDDQSLPAATNLTFDWAVLPGVSQATLQSYATPANRPWVIVTNTAAIQSLSVPSESWLGAVFHSASATLYATGLTVSVSRPTVLLITTSSNQIATIYAADPYENMLPPYTNTTVPFTNSLYLTNQLTVTINGNSYPLTLPSWPYLGKTVSATVSLSSSNVAPIIVIQPTPTNAVAGNAASFAVAAAAMPAPTYQWQRNNTNIVGATNLSYALVAAVADNGASFSCVVSNTSGSVTSNPALLAVNDTPTISTVADQVVNKNTVIPLLGFIVNDSQIAPGSLAVTATSSNPALVPNVNLVLGGSGSNRTVKVTSVANQTGYATINLTVSDGTLNSSIAFMVTVLNGTNLPPVLLAITNRAIIAGVNLAVASQATDPNSPLQTLGFLLPTKPSGANINGASGQVSWRPTISQSGTSNQFTIVVTNTSNLAATQSFWVGVITPQKPVISAPSFFAGQFHLTISGDAGPDYTVQGTTNLAAPAWQTLFISNSPTLPFVWTQTNAANLPVNFYRVMLGP